MATPDGISAKDWERVHELAVDIVNADEDESEGFRTHLLDYLYSLEEKYGELPSILATRADYTNDLRLKERLLARAYGLAMARSDDRNALYIAHSLAELSIEEFRDAKEGHKWLNCVKQHLAQIDDSWFAGEHDRLRNVIQQSLPVEGD
jgi:hypothetical protein